MDISHAFQSIWDMFNLQGRPLFEYHLCRPPGLSGQWSAYGVLQGLLYVGEDVNPVRTLHVDPDRHPATICYHHHPLRGHLLPVGILG